MEAGKEYTFYMQLTSAYGKLGQIVSFIQSMLTDVLVSSSIVAGPDHIILNIAIESGIGSLIEVECAGELGSFSRSSYRNFM